MRAYCIAVAGAVGSSKTTIASYLSQNLNIAILNNDALRSEIRESIGSFDESTYEKLRKQKLQSLIDKKLPFIYDASIDRRWGELKTILDKSNYIYFVISLNYTKPLIEKLLIARGSDISTLDKYMSDHDNFLKLYASEVNLHLSDKDFDNSLKISLDAVEDWLKSRF